VTVASDLSGWTPYSVRSDGSGTTIRWCYTDGLPFTDPFFEQTIERCLLDPFRLLFWRETDAAELAEFAARRPGLAPAGFIFHMSRCGSTLVSQMLAGVPRALVISEAPPIDAAIRAGSGDGLRSIVSALGQRRAAEQETLVVKLDAWAILDLALIRRAFPGVPCVFVYRDPLEVLASQLGHRGYHVIPGTLPPERFGLAAGEPEAMPPERYVATALASLCAAAARGAREHQLTLIDYPSLPGAVLDTIAPLFGIELSSSERARLEQIATRDAKNPYLEFEADSEAKSAAASPAARSAAAEIAGPAHAELELLRSEQT
jgi:hypothetical protein